MLPQLPTCLRSQSNWKAYSSSRDSDDQPCYGGTEYPLYSDARLTGDLPRDLGPYALLNALPFETGTHASIAIVLRVFFYEPHWQNVQNPQPLATNDAGYHGGSLADEFAALTSLGLGIRLKSGDANRHFDAGDQYGRFRAFQLQSTPTLSIRPDQAIIPAPVRRSLEEIRDRLLTIPDLNPRLYTELVRSARSYQDALWIAESDPHLSWLLLVSAIEIAANAHITLRGNPTENLKEFQPTLAELIENSAGPELLDGVADQLKHLYSATKKFMLFCEEFTPNEPEERPEHQFQRLQWTWLGLKPIVKKVYDLRSRALHAGVPFPAPMCLPPERYTQGSAPSEIAVTSLAQQTMGGQWLPRDAPITLNTFQYFVRGALLRWWDHISSESEQM